MEVTPTPAVAHVDPRTPYALDDLLVITGATASFYDRITNMVGVGVWGVLGLSAKNHSQLL